MKRLALVLLLWGCDDAPPTDAGAATIDAGPADARCVTFEADVAGALGDASLDELSGLASSRAHGGLLYGHNDSGGGAEVFLLGEDGAARGTIALSGAASIDYEDIAVGPGPDGAPWVYVGDVGDNAARMGGTPRGEIVVYRFPEADVDPTAPRSVTPESITLRYPDAPHDCESVAVSSDGDLYLLTKEDAPESELYLARAPLGSEVTLELVARVLIGPGSRNATAMDMAPGGRGLLVRSYNRAHLYLREEGETWATAVARPPLPVPARPETQGESIAWRADGRAYFTASEGAGSTLHRYDADPSCDPL